MKKKNVVTSTPKVIKGISFFDMIKEVSKRAEESNKNYKATGLCQANVEVSEGVWEPCKRKADPNNQYHFCKECQEEQNRLIKELRKSQGPGDFLITL